MVPERVYVTLFADYKVKLLITGTAVISYTTIVWIEVFNFNLPFSNFKFQPITSVYITPAASQICLALMEKYLVSKLMYKTVTH